MADCIADGGIWKPYPACDCRFTTPIIINLSSNRYELTDVANGVNFDLNADGLAERTAWTAASSDQAFLALDRNLNGVVDNGLELFGNLTSQPASAHPSGFMALTEFDKPEKGGNGDGVIDAQDNMFSSLLLWCDANHNGISEPDEVSSLPEVGIYSISLNIQQSGHRDAVGNVFRYRAKVNEGLHSHVAEWAYDVLLVGP